MNILVLLIGVLIMEIIMMIVFFFWFRSFNYMVTVRYISGSRKGLIKMLRAKVQKRKGINMLVFMNKRIMRPRKLSPGNV